MEMIEKPARIYEHKERDIYENRVRRRNRLGTVSGNGEGIGSSKERRIEQEPSEGNIQPGIPGRAGRDSLSQDSNGSAGGHEANANGPVHRSSHKVPDRESSGQSTGNENTGNLVQHHLPDRQPGDGYDGRGSGAAETAASGSGHGELHGAGEIQRMD